MRSPSHPFQMVVANFGAHTLGCASAPQVTAFINPQWIIHGQLYCLYALLMLDRPDQFYVGSPELRWLLVLGLEACLAEHLHEMRAQRIQNVLWRCLSVNWLCTCSKRGKVVPGHRPHCAFEKQTSPASNPAGSAAAAVWRRQQTLRPGPASVSAAPAAGFSERMGACGGSRPPCASVSAGVSATLPCLVKEDEQPHTLRLPQVHANSAFEGCARSRRHQHRCRCNSSTPPLGVRVLTL